MTSILWLLLLAFTTTVLSASSTSSSTSASASATSTVSPKCPAYNATIYFTTSESGYLIECGIDHKNGDMASPNGLTATSLKACIALCDARAGCVDVSLSGVACYLKSTVGEAVYNGVNGAKLIGNLTGSASISLPAIYNMTTSAVCPGSNNTIFTTTSGAKYLIRCGIDHKNGDMPSPNGQAVANLAACIALCDARAGCVDVSMSGVACYLKSTIGANVYSGGVYGAQLLIAGTTTTVTASSTSTSSTTTAYATATSAVCPDSNNEVYIVPNSGAEYLIECGIDHTSGDMASPNGENVADLAACIALCDARDGCVDVSMSGSACYLKDVLGPAQSNYLIFGARLLAAGNATTSTTMTSSASSTTMTSLTSSTTMMNSTLS